MSLTLTCAARWALTEEGCHAVVASGTPGAGGVGTVIDVLTAVVARPTIHTHAVVAAQGIQTCAPILAGVWHQVAFVDVLLAELTCELQSSGAVSPPSRAHLCTATLQR